MSSEPLPPRVLAGRGLIGAGAICLLWAVLFMTSHAIGGPPEHFRFSERRPYDRVKEETQAAVPGMAWRGLLGLVLLSVGARLARRDVR